MQAGKPAGDHRRGRRGRGPGHPGRQQDPRHLHAAWPSRPPASASAARPCSRTSPSSPAARSSPRRSASSWRTSTLDLLGTARKVVVTKDETTIVEGARHRRRHQGPDQPDQGRDREHRLRLRPREAPGAPGQAVRRRGRHQGRRGHRGRAQGEEAPHRGRRLHHQGGHRGGRRPRRRRGPAARRRPPSSTRPRSSRATRPPVPASWPGPSRSR